MTRSLAGGRGGGGTKLIEGKADQVHDLIVERATIGFCLVACFVKNRLRKANGKPYDFLFGSFWHRLTSCNCSSCELIIQRFTSL
jgi:hypothetical protein